MTDFPGDEAGEHPSFLALDRRALGAASPAIDAHLEACERCRSHVQAMAPLTGARPGWLLDATRPRRWFFDVRWVSAASALAVAAGLFFVLRAAIPPEALEGSERNAAESAGVRAKGLATVTVYLQRGDRVVEWTGQPVFPGDALELGLSSPSPRVVLVLGAGEPGGPWTVLWQGRVAPTGRLLLPVSFRIDARGREERVAVILSPEPLSEEALDALRATPEAVAEGVEKYLFFFRKDLSP